MRRELRQAAKVAQVPAGGDFDPSSPSHGGQADNQGWAEKTKPKRSQFGAGLGRLTGGFALGKTCFYRELSYLAGFEAPDGGPGKITERSQPFRSERDYGATGQSKSIVQGHKGRKGRKGRKTKVRMNQT
jgi:hypothetical protein